MEIGLEREPRNGESGDLDSLPLAELGKSGQSRPPARDEDGEDEVEEAGIDSFPASDPPAFS